MLWNDFYKLSTFAHECIYCSSIYKSRSRVCIHRRCNHLQLHILFYRLYWRICNLHVPVDAHHLPVPKVGEHLSCCKSVAKVQIKTTTTKLCLKDWFELFFNKNAYFNFNESKSSFRILNKIYQCESLNYTNPLAAIKLVFQVKSWVQVHVKLDAERLWHRMLSVGVQI